jgi:DNA-binding CsgD family transcriptional regulator
MNWLDAMKPQMDAKIAEMLARRGFSPDLVFDFDHVHAAVEIVEAAIAGTQRVTESVAHARAIDAVQRAGAAQSGSPVRQERTTSTFFLIGENMSPPRLPLAAETSLGLPIPMGPLLPRVTRIDPIFRARFGRIAAHLGVGQRYRRLQKTSPRASVFSPSAKLLHAEGDAAKPEARAALAQAVVAIDRARGRQRRADPDGALAARKGLVAARWSLVDEFESDGKRYVVARENEPSSVPITALSKRERQIVGYVALGHSSKLIAYELGIADSTVRVLLSRAMQRLQVTSREELATRLLTAETPPTQAETGGARKK